MRRALLLVLWVSPLEDFALPVRSERGLVGEAPPLAPCGRAAMVSAGTLRGLGCRLALDVSSSPQAAKRDQDALLPGLLPSS